MRSVITVTLVELVCTPRFDFDLALRSLFFSQVPCRCIGVAICISYDIYSFRLAIQFHMDVFVWVKRGM